MNNTVHIVTNKCITVDVLVLFAVARTTVLTTVRLCAYKRTFDLRN